MDIQFRYKRFLFTIYTVAVMFMNHAFADLGTSPVEQQEFYDFILKSDPLTSLEHNIREQTASLEGLESFISGLETEIDVTSDDVSAHEHPVKALRYVATLGSELPEVVAELTEELDVDELLKFRKKMPKYEDLSEIVTGVLRMHLIFALKVPDMAAGLMVGRVSRSLTTEECADVAFIFHQIAISINVLGDVTPLATEWTEYSSRRCLDEGRSDLATRLQVSLLNMVRESYKQRNCTCSRQAMAEEKHWIQRNRNLTVPKRSDDNDCSGQMLKKCGQKPDAFKTMRKYFSALCQGKSLTDVKPDYVEPETRMRSCRYEHNNNPWLMIGPMKVEELNSAKPKVTMYHEAMYDSEIAQLIDLGKPGLMRSFLTEGSDVYSSDKRTGDLSDLTDDKDALPVMTKVRNRLQAFSGFVLKSKFSENTRIANYPVGGYFDLHSDFFQNGSIGDNNRMATMLVYLNDVEGGDTIFPWINLKLNPVKGAAALWENQYRSGRNMWASIHGSCPVIQGDKWIYVYKIKKYGNEFTKPCLLDENE